MKKYFICLLLCLTSSWVHAAIRLSCEIGTITQTDNESISSFFDVLGLSPNWYKIERGERFAGYDNGKEVYVFWTGATVSTTRHIYWEPKLNIKNEEYLIFNKNGRPKMVKIASKKEIVMALMMTENVRSIHSKRCENILEALVDHVGVRQSIVAWSDRLEWGWPDGGPAQWNAVFWNKGTPWKKDKTIEAFTDMFTNPEKYSVGCYTATKMVMVHAVLDYYHRIKNDSKQTQKVIDLLWEDSDPLVGVEDRKMWSFEDDFDHTEFNKKGKILEVQENIGKEQFVPGDWAYFINTDSVSYQKTGYEGSNAIYLGNNRFNDHYNDNGGHYLFHEKIKMIWNWRNGVFSRSGDYDKWQSIGLNQVQELSESPEKGGFLFTFRAVPKTIER